MSINSTPSKAVAQFASGLFGYAVGAPTNDAVLAQAALTGLNPIYNSFYAQNLSALSADSVATLLVSNVGVVAGQNGLTAAQVTEAVKYVKGQLTAAAATGTQGQVAASLLVGFSNMTADPVFGAAARAWNTQVDKDMAYTASGATADVPVALAIVATPTPVTYTVAADKTSISEGDTVTYTVTTTGVDAGITLYYTLSGTPGSNAAASNNVGTLTIDQAGKASIIVPTVNDTVVDNGGQLTFKLSGNLTAAATPAVVVSVASEDHTITHATEAYAIAANHTSINEGQSVTYTVTTTGVTPGTRLYYSVTGTPGTNAAASNIVGSMIVDDQGIASVTVPTVNDNIVNNPGHLTFQLTGSLAATATQAPDVTVLSEDQSGSPTYAVTSAVATVDEGATATFNIHTSNIAGGTSLHYAIGGTASLDANATTSGNVTIDTSGNAIVTVRTLDNNFKDADKTLNLTLTALNGDQFSLATPIAVVDNTDKNGKSLTTGRDTTGFDFSGATLPVQFDATVGTYANETTLTSDDKLVGTIGKDTLYVTVTGDEAKFQEFSTNGSGANFVPALNGIENVVLDTTQRDILGSADYDEDTIYNQVELNGGRPLTGIYTLLGAVSGVDASYFDTERTYKQDGSVNTAGSLEKLTIKDTANDSAYQSEFNNVYLHKNMTLEFVGNGIANQAGDLDEDVMLAKAVTETTVNLDGVGGNYGATLWFSQENDRTWSTADQETESSVVTFTGLSSGDSVTVGGLTFTAITTLTAADVAAEFDGLSGGSTGIPDVLKGTFTGALTGFSSGAVSGDSVIFTSTTPFTNVDDLTATTLDLEGTSGVDDFNLLPVKTEGVAPTWINDGEVSLKHLTITGKLAHMSQVGDFDAALTIAGDTFWYGEDSSDDNPLFLQEITPETITVSLDKTLNADSEKAVNDINVIFNDCGDNVLRDVTLVDFSASHANISTGFYAEDFYNGSSNRDAVTIKDGLGDDTIGLAVGSYYSARTTVTIDLGASSNDLNSVYLTNQGAYGPYSVGNVKLVTDQGQYYHADLDLSEDLITISNFDFAADGDKLYMPTMINAGNVGGSASGSFDYAYEIVGVTGSGGNSFESDTSNHAGVTYTNIANTASTGTTDPDKKFFNAVKAVADALVLDADSNHAAGILTADLETHYSATFLYGGAMYVYIDSNRTYEAAADGVTGITNNYIGLSTGDVLIKLTGSNLPAAASDIIFDAASGLFGPA